MIVTYLGNETFRIQVGDLVLACNPPAKSSDFKMNKFGANVVLQTIKHPDMGGGKEFSYGEKEPFVISGPGEYESNGLFIKGVAGESKYDLPKGVEKCINTIYSTTVDGINILYLGAQSAPMPAGLSDIVDSVDMLFIPIGGNGTYDAKEAAKIVLNLEPKIVVPMGYSSAKDANLAAFLKETGSKGETVDKLTIKKKDLEGKDQDVVVLAPQV
ncbi:MAG: MBL fold metallo-hydrolase [bacterium]|jgi:L-ascorbate metabolism protein UlaG (beta-lactamase superfamily)